MLDPDVVYSYVGLDNVLLDRIDRDWMPTAVQVHRSNDGRFEPSFREAPEPLHALSLIPYLANNRGWGPPRPLALLTRYLSATIDPFVADSFGISDFGPGTAQAEDVLRYANTIALGDRAANPNQSVATKDVADTLALLPRLTSFASETLTMAEMSGIGYDAHHQTLEPAWDIYNIIVGDFTIDRIAFWNARVGAEPWLRKQIIALRIPEAHLENPAFRSALIDYVARTAYTRHGGAPKMIVLRSSSVSEERMQPLIEPFLLRGVHAQIAPFTDPADCAATKPSNWPTAHNAESGRYSESPLTLRAVQPPHLAVWPVLRPMLTSGAWVVRATFSGVVQGEIGDGKLKFPRRWQSVFDLRANVLAKPARSGSLRLLVKSDTKPVEFLLPFSDERFVRNLLFGYYFRTTTEPRVALHREIPRVQVVTSSAGRQLIRLLSKLDDLGEAFALIRRSVLALYVRGACGSLARRK